MHDCPTRSGGTHVSGITFNLFLQPMALAGRCCVGSRIHLDHIFTVTLCGTPWSSLWELSPLSAVDKSVFTHSLWKEGPKIRLRRHSSQWTNRSWAANLGLVRTKGECFQPKHANASATQWGAGPTQRALCTLPEGGEITLLAERLLAWILKHSFCFLDSWKTTPLEETAMPPPAPKPARRHPREADVLPAPVHCISMVWALPVSGILQSFCCPSALSGARRSRAPPQRHADDCIRALDAEAIKPGRGFAVKRNGGKIILFSGGERRGGSSVPTSRRARLQSSWQTGVAHRSREGHGRVGSLKEPNSLGGLFPVAGEVTWQAPGRSVVRFAWFMQFVINGSLAAALCR